MTPDGTSDRPPGYDDMLSSIMELAENLRGLQELGVAQYTPVVENIIAARSRDATLDPAATANYVNFYREMWEEETVEKEVKT